MKIKSSKGINKVGLKQNRGYATNEKHKEGSRQKGKKRKKLNPENKK